jgi:phosphoribosylformylglycinamidine cyclo-ligase
MPEGLAARLDPSRWTMPSVMRLFGALGGMDDEELRATFNGGLGMVVVVPPRAIPAALDAFESHGIPAAIVGEIVDAAGLDGTRYVEGPLERAG